MGFDLRGRETGVSSEFEDSAIRALLCLERFVDLSVLVETERAEGSASLLDETVGSTEMSLSEASEEEDPSNPAARKSSCAPGLESFSAPNSSRSVEGEFSRKTLGSKVPPSTYDKSFMFLERLRVMLPFVV